MGRELAERHRELANSVVAARQGIARVDARWGWRRALRFGVRQRMYLPEYWPLYARYLARRVRQPHIEFGGMAFLGKRVELQARRHHARMVIGPWCWIGSDNKLRVHEGNLRLGAKVVLGSSNVVNAYLDIEIGDDCLLSDWIYVCDFDHAHERLDMPIRKQGIVKAPVRIGADVWVGEKSSILRGADIGTGSVIGSQSLVRGVIPPFSIAVGSPARVVRSRLPRGMTAAEAVDLRRRGVAIPGDPLGE